MKNLLKRNVKQRIIKTDGYGRWLQKRSDGYGTGNGSFPHGRRIKKKYGINLQGAWVKHDSGIYDFCGKDDEGEKDSV